MIVIYPQQKWDWYNSFTCTDYKGYSTLWSNDYLTKDGPQMKAFKAMLDRVTQPRDESKWDYMSNNANIYASQFTEPFIWTPYLFIKNFGELIGTITSMFYIIIFIYGGL